MAKNKRLSWHERDRNSRLANILFASLADDETKKEMASLATAEGKKSPQQGIEDAEKARQSQSRTKWK
jgi:hypothetical protein